MAETPRQLIDTAQAAAGGAVDPLVFQLAVFAMAVFAAFCLMRSASPTRKAPVLPATAAVSSVIIVGALISIGVDASAPGEDGPLWARLFGFIALMLASASMVGGFLASMRSLPVEKQG